jgi:hypothetical protein
MDGYKKIIKSPKIRALILDCLSFLPDSLMLSIQYRIKTGRKLNIKNPKRFTEKIQWYKMNYHNPIMHQCVDKYLVRDYVKTKGLESILVPLIKKYNLVTEIKWEELPSAFVIKTTNGGGGLNVVVCNDKTKLNYHEIVNKISANNKPVKAKTGGREWAYYGLQEGVIIEELLVNDENPEAGINDYKIFCYNGKPEYIVVDIDRYIGHKRNFYDTNWKNLNITSDCPKSDKEIYKPSNFNKMLEIASILSKDFPFVRVDLYNIKGKIYFGELTFYPWSGYVQYNPDDADFLFGKHFELRKG